MRKCYPMITEINYEVKGMCLGGETFLNVFLQGYWEDFYVLARGRWSV